MVLHCQNRQQGLHMDSDFADLAQVLASCYHFR